MPSFSAGLRTSIAGWPHRERFRGQICLLCVLIGTCVSWLPRWAGPIDLRWDAGTYYILGTSLAEGKGYRLLNEPGNIEAVQYPPLLPVIVALHQKGLVTSDPAIVGRWLRFTYFLFSACLAATSFALARFFLPRRYAVPLALTCVWTYQMLFLSTLCFAELPFSLATVLCAYWSYKPSRGWGAQAGAGAAAIAAYLLRTVGIALLAAWVAEAVFQKRFRVAAARALVAGIPVFAWQGYVHSVEQSAQYRHPPYSYQRAPWMFYNVSYVTNLTLLSPFEPAKGIASQRNFAGRVAGNLATLPYNLGQLLFAPSKIVHGYHQTMERMLSPLTIPWWLVNGLMGLLGWCVIAGMSLWLWQGKWLLGIYLAITLLAVCLTPWPGQILRYLAPTIPFLLLATFGLFHSIELRGFRVNSWSRRLTRTGSLALTCGLLLACLATGTTAFKNLLNAATFMDSDGTARPYRLFFFLPEFVSVQKSMGWLKTHVPSSSVIAVSMPHWVFLNTGLKTVMPPLETDIVRAQQMLDSVPTSYLIIEHMLMEQSFNEQFPALIRQSPDRWRLVHAEGDVEIYQRTSGAGSVALPLAGS